MRTRRSQRPKFERQTRNGHQRHPIWMRELKVRHCSRRHRKKARVTHEQLPSNPEEEESDSESTFEKEQNEIAERQRDLSARQERKRKERMTNQQKAEKKAEAERDPETAKLLEKEDKRSPDSEDWNIIDRGREKQSENKYSSRMRLENIDWRRHGRRFPSRKKKQKTIALFIFRGSTISEDTSKRTRRQNRKCQQIEITWQSQRRFSATISRKRKKPIQTSNLHAGKKQREATLARKA